MAESDEDVDVGVGVDVGIGVAVLLGYTVSVDVGVWVGVLFALKGDGNRAFYRSLLPKLPERTRLFRLFTTHQAWTDAFLVVPGLLSIVDSYEIELIHPVREGRSPQQIGKKDLSNRRWIVGGKLCFILSYLGLVVGWDCATANVYDTHICRENE